ncbi:type III-B CRISPR-associated protein Cas10/Cmr2 [Bacteroidetes/Chlorobi group bacterium Naka2016]|jgi:CRISPR-associated protein Cmr2|nr:MAG: type III-B CRISPR-associated protein Cas10/Cmr2 [Bacteroidetes/Chlorobi group bacterium Naka2016]
MSKNDDIFSIKLRAYLHDPIDKCIDIPGHVERAKRYAEILHISGVEEAKGPDQIASCMERSLLPKGKIYKEFTEIRHPLSEGKLEAPHVDKNVFFQSVKEIFEDIANDFFQYSYRKKFLYLWRNLIELMCEKFKDKEIGKFIPVLPADTRIPDHSIWEHLKIASAIDALRDEENKQLNQNNSLFLFSIGPVQYFISQARKTHDLFMGSFILTYLTFKAIEIIIEKYGPANIIYPDLHGQPLMDHFLSKKEKIAVKNSSTDYTDQPTIPNRFVAIIPETDKAEIANLATEVEKAVKSEWKVMVNKVLDEFGLKNINSEFIEKQIKDFPEIYWTAIPLRKGEEDVNIDDFSEFFEEKLIKEWKEIYMLSETQGEYPPNIGLLYQLAYSALEKSMGARKNLRNFEQTEEFRKKCHLCGEREGVIEANKGNLKVGKYISSTEGLCIRCFTKRALDRYLTDVFGDKFKNFSFPSTAEVACSDFKERALRVAQDEFNEYVKAFKNILKDKFEQVDVSFLPKIEKDYGKTENLEGIWFFEKNLKEKEFIEQCDFNISQENIKDLEEKLKNLIKKVGKPNPYYAVIMLDGDSMGKWLSGENLPKIEYAYNSETWKKLPYDFKRDITQKLEGKFLTPAIHASISTALRNYAIEFVREIVEEQHLGKLVYSGGDDVLAFVNLRDLFEVIRQLRATFSGHTEYRNGKIEVDWTKNTGFVEKNGRYFLTMGPAATASCGVVIAHYKMPLKLVLDKIREMEKNAKKVDGKDAFGIALMKHSGQIKEFVCKWRLQKDGQWIDTVEELNKLSEYFKKDETPKIKISRTFPYKLHDAFLRNKDKDGTVSITGTIFETELKRLLLRSLEGGGNKRERKKVADELSEMLLALFWHSGIGSNIDKFVNLLEVARIISTTEE